MTIVLFFELIGPYYDSVTLFVEFQVGHQILVRFLHRFFFLVEKIPLETKYSWDLFTSKTFGLHYIYISGF